MQVVSEDNHPGIVKMIDSYEDSSSVTLVLEYIEGMSLYSWIIDVHKKSNFPERVSKYIFRQILNSIAHIHSRGIAHRDIKLDNILIFQDSTTKEWVTKIIDFGLSAVFL